MTAAPVSHQFDDAAQQSHAVRLGMWLFLSSEVLLFAVLLTAYAAARSNFPAGFAEAGHHLYKWIGVSNTAVLLISSAVMASAVETRPASSIRKAVLLLITAALGLCFLAIKGVEYTLDYRDALLPNVRFDAAAFANPSHASLFLIFYWIMTGLHALHVLGGVAIITAMAIRVFAGRDPPGVSNSVHAVGLYWHFVDIVWLFLLPLLYLNP